VSIKITEPITKAMTPPRPSIPKVGINWQAICDQPLHKNEKVIVTAIEGLLLQVIPLKNKENK
jgi:membrane-bound ClpP family serine protease